jgi:thermostable 8-oxoguanine DNA glycosylase
MKLIFSALLFCFFTAAITAQELNCQVQLLAPQIQGTTEKKVLETFRQAVYEFMNNTKWTKDQYKPEERIECSLIINVNDKVSNDEYDATLQVQSNRPIYKTSYKSLVFNYKDPDFRFKYIEFQPLEFSETTYLSGLTSILSFYAYMIIGIDYDTYSLEGGTPYFLKAQNMVSNAQNAAEKGWKAFENVKNRYWLVENTLNQTYKPLREFNYKYHRLGFDEMSKNVANARATILQTLNLLSKVYQEKPGSYFLQTLLFAKSDELISLFTQAQPDEKAKAYNILTEVDNPNSNKYQKITANN